MSRKEATRTKRQIVKTGDVVAIPLWNNKWMYGRQYKVSTGFYDLPTDECIKDVEILRERKVLFYQGVYVRVLSSGRWPKIGKLPLTEIEQKTDIITCMGSGALAVHKFYSELLGKAYGNPSLQECYNLEHTAAWDYKSIEVRLMHYIETGEDHPRMWDGGPKLEAEVRGEWKELFDPKFLISPIDLEEEYNNKYGPIHPPAN